MGATEQMRSKTGAAYVLALVTLLVGTILALAMLRSANAVFRAEDSRFRKQAAYNLAEAGLDYAYYQIHYQNRPLPYTLNTSLGSGTVEIQAADDGGRDVSTMLITATGTYGSHKYTMKRVMLGLLPYHYAYCENRNTDTAASIISTGTGRGVRANGQVKFDGTATNVTTGAWATTIITTKGIITPQYPGSPPIVFPEIDYAYYLSIADYRYTVDTAFVSPNFSGRTVVIHVQGKVSVGGVYRGYLTLVSTGDATISASLMPGDTDSCLAIVTTSRIIVKSRIGSIRAILYSRRPDGNGEINVGGYNAIIGAAASDDIKPGNPATFNPDPSINLAAMRRLRLPGL